MGFHKTLELWRPVYDVQTGLDAGVGVSKVQSRKRNKPENHRSVVSDRGSFGRHFQVAQLEGKMWRNPWRRCAGKPLGERERPFT